MDAEQLKLGDDFSIVHLSKDEKESLLSEAMRFPQLETVNPFYRPEYALEAFFTVKKIVGEARAGKSGEPLQPARGAAFFGGLHRFTIIQRRRRQLLEHPNGHSFMDSDRGCVANIADCLDSGPRKKKIFSIRRRDGGLFAILAGV